MKIVTLGEIMIRLQPYDHLRFVQTDTLQYTYGGGEANVAVSLANYGADVAFVTKLPAHAIGQAGVNALRRYGVDTSKITRGGDRVGIYFNEKGASQRGSVCIYDRAHSAMADATVADFDFDKIFEGVEVAFGKEPAIAESGDYTFFAGARSDAFFFDFDGIKNLFDIRGGRNFTALHLSGEFPWTGVDSNTQANVCSMVLELPTAQLLGTTPDIRI